MNEPLRVGMPAFCNFWFLKNAKKYAQETDGIVYTRKLFKLKHGSVSGFKRYIVEFWAEWKWS